MRHSRGVLWLVGFWQQVERCHPPAGVKQSPMVAEPLNRAAFPRPGVLATPQHTTTHMRVPNDPKVGRGAAHTPPRDGEKSNDSHSCHTLDTPPSRSEYIAGQMKFGQMRSHGAGSWHSA